MLPNSGFNSFGYHSDARGFRKKGRPWRAFQQYAPYIALLELVILLVVIVTSTSSIKYGNTHSAFLQSRLEARETENQNLKLDISRERETKRGVENRLRDLSTTLNSAQREAQELKSRLSEKEGHWQSLQQSFDSTRLALEAERDQARYEVKSLNDRVAALQHSLATLDKNAAERERASAMQHQEKDKTHASKEAAWEQMRNMLETQIKAQGGYVDPYLAHMQAGGQQPQHPDYAAQAGSQAFHPAVNGAQERFIDTAQDLEREGVTDSQGTSHLAQLLGHLFDMKMAEFQAIDDQPGQIPQPRPPIGHWMAQNLERAGVSCKYGTIHMAYILDRHFSVQASPKIAGRAKVESGQPAGSGSPPSLAAPHSTMQGGSSEGSQEESFGRASMGVPGIITDKAKQDTENLKSARERFDKDRDAVNAWRTKHKVDAAGFV